MTAWASIQGGKSKACIIQIKVQPLADNDEPKPADVSEIEKCYLLEAVPLRNSLYIHSSSASLPRSTMIHSAAHDHAPISYHLAAFRMAEYWVKKFKEDTPTT